MFQVDPNLKIQDPKPGNTIGEVRFQPQPRMVVSLNKGIPT